MGDLTRTQARDELWLSLERHNDVDPATTPGQTQLNRWLDQAYKHISLPSTYRHPELQTSDDLALTAGVASVALNSTNWVVDHILNVSANRNLKAVTKEALDRFNTTTTGMPSIYARWGNTIYFNRTPDASMTGQIFRAFVYVIPTALASDGAKTLLRAVFDEPWIEYAAALAWRRLGDFARSDAHRESYAALINDIRGLDIIDGYQDTTGFQIEPLQDDYMPS